MRFELSGYRLSIKAEVCDADNLLNLVSVLLQLSTIDPGASNVTSMVSTESLEDFKNGCTLEIGLVLGSEVEPLFVFEGWTNKG